MKDPGFCSAITLSFFLHITIITLSFFLGQGLYTRKMVTPYIVSLVSPSETAGSEKVSPSRASQEAAAPEIAKSAEKLRMEVAKPAKKPRMSSYTETRRKKESDTTIVKNRIEELKAIQKLERLAALRKIVDIGAGQPALQSKTSSGAASRNNITGSGGATSGGSDYYSLVEAKIR